MAVTILLSQNWLDAALWITKDFKYHANHDI